MGLLIPRVFHRVWLGGMMPDEYVRYGEGWARRHPGWRVLEWRDGLLPPLAHPRLFAGEPLLAVKSDLARLDIVLAHGGVYLDCDFECLECIEPLLDGVACFAARQMPPGGDPHEVNNAVFGAVPGHPAIREAVALVPERYRPDVWGSVGPALLTEVARRRQDVTLFPKELFYPYFCNEPERKGQAFPGAYAVHHWGSARYGKTRAPASPAPGPRRVRNLGSCGDVQQGSPFSARRRPPRA